MREINIEEYLFSQGYATIQSNFRSKILEWLGWYQGDVQNFHPYRVYNGNNYLSRKRCTLGMGKKVCEDWANLLMNEEVSIVLGGKKEQDFFDSVILDNNFWVKINEMQELKSCLGTVAYVPYADGVQIDPTNSNIVGGGGIKINYVTALNIYPLAWENGIITQCAFTSQFFASEPGQKEVQSYVYLQMHIFVEGLYEIHNTIFKENSGQLKIIDNINAIKGFENVASVIKTGSPKRQFVIDRLAIANNIDFNNPLGIAVFANSIDVLKGIDLVYDSYNNEFELGKKRIMVSSKATQRMGDSMIFDPNDVAFYTIPEDQNDTQIIHEIDMSLRVADHEEALQSRLTLFSSKCGLGERYYSFNSAGVVTATQVMSENSTMFRTLKKHEIILESALTELAQIILTIGRDVLKQPLNPDVEISIDFDDSIIEDKDSMFNRDARLVQMGIMRNEEFRAKYLNEDLETAKNNLPGLETLDNGEVT